MALSNAERQKKHRERVKVKLTNADPLHLNAKQLKARDAVMSEPIYPVPTERGSIPTFLGWNRYDWSAVPKELADFMGMSEAWEGWKREHDAMRRV